MNQGAGRSVSQNEENLDFLMNLNSRAKSSIEGRLGLFHYIQRTTKTLKKNHTDHFTAVQCASQLHISIQ